MTVQVEEQLVRFQFFGREQGSLKRDDVRRWLAQPIGRLSTEWLVFTSRRNRLYLAMGAAPTRDFALPPDFVRELRDLI